MPEATPQPRKRRKLYKEILQKPWVRRGVCRLGAAYIRLCYRSSRWRVLGGEIPAQLWRERQPFLLAFWHGRILMMPHIWDYATPIYMMISAHRDGQLIAGTVGHYGVRTIASSTSSGGARGFRELLRALQGGACVGITPDGPRGPGMHVQEGIIQAARLSGTPIVPVTYAVSRRRVLGTWDRFVIALPFARGIIAWGEPIHVARDASEEEQQAVRERLADALNRLTFEADEACGQVPVTPHPERRPEHRAQAPSSS